jgi:hypothetical protein
MTLLITVFTLFAGTLFSIPTDDQVRQSANTLGIPFDELNNFVKTYYLKQSITETIKTTAEILIPEFKENRAKIRYQYDGKMLEITGTIGEIFSTYYRLEIERDHMVVEFLPSDIEKVINLKKGQRVTVIGKLDAHGTTLWLNEAYLK